MAEVLRSRMDGAVQVLTLNRPEKLNALNRSLIEALEDALAAAETDRRVRAIVITGAGRAFSAGADIAEFASAMEAGPATASRDFVRPGQSLTRRIETFRKPSSRRSMVSPSAADARSSRRCTWRSRPTPRRLPKPRSR